MTPKRPGILLPSLVVCLVALAGAASAQVAVDTSELAGTVADESRLPAAGVSVTLLELSKGRVRATVTGEDGRYRFALLAPGAYRLEASAPSFQPVTVDRVVLEVGAVLRFDVTLRLAAATFVRVEANALAAAHDRTQLSSVVTTRDLDELPLNTRNYLEFALLTPGVIESTTLVEQADFRVPTAPPSGLSFSGGNGRGNGMTIDGVPHNGATGNFRPSVPQEAVQEFQVNRSGFGAETGGNSGGALNIVTRSGSNVHRGSAFALFRDRSLQSANYFEPATSPYRRWQTGGGAGGPIRRNRSFYFGAAELLRRDETQFVTTLHDPEVLSRLTPGQAELVGALGASDSAGLIALGAALRHTLTPGSNPAVSHLFAANSGVFPFEAASEHASGRLDQAVGPRQSLVVRVSGARLREDNARLGAQAGWNHGSSTSWSDLTAAVADHLTISESWLAVIRGAYAASGFTILPNDVVGPELVINGYGVFGRDYLYPLRQRERYIDFQGTVSHFRGSHSFKFGAAFTHVRSHVNLDTFFGGRFIFGEFIPLDALVGVMQGDPGAGAALRSLMLTQGRTAASAAVDAPMTALQAFSLGLPVAYIQAFGDSASSATRHQHGVFVEDVVRPHPRLTLTGGMRVQHNGLTNLPSRTYVEPRGGAAWTIGTRTAARVSGGVFHSWVDGTIGYSAKQLQRDDVTNVFIPLTGAAGIVNPATGHPVTSADVYQTLLAGGVLGRRAVRLEDLAPLGLRPGIPFPVTGGVDADYRPPVAYQLGAEVDHAFGRLETSVAYTYSRTRNLWRTVDRNLRQTGRRPDGTPAYGLADPRLLNNYVIESSGRAAYHALTVSARHRVSEVWSVAGHVTVSHARDDVTDFNIDYAAHHQLEPAADWGPSSFNSPRRLVASAMFSPGGHAASRSWRDGWSVAAILRASAGRPFNILTGFDNVGDGQTNTHRPQGLGRNAGTGPAFVGLDARAGWILPRTQGRVRLTLDVFNLLNRVNFSTINTFVGSSPAASLRSPITGRIGSVSEPLSFTGAYEPRQLQVGTRVTF
jgi:hypothetical protein